MIRICIGFCNGPKEVRPSVCASEALLQSSLRQPKLGWGFVAASEGAAGTIRQRPTSR